jgi:cell division protease FtsH
MSKKNKNILDKFFNNNWKDNKKNKDGWDNKKIPNKLNKNPKQPIVYLLLVSLVISAWYTIFWDNLLSNYNKVPAKEVSLSEMQTKYNAWELKEVKINNTKISAKLNWWEVSDEKIDANSKEWEKIFSFKLVNENVNDLWFNNPDIETEVKVEDTEWAWFWKELTLSIIPIIIIFIIISLIMKNSMKWLWGRMWFWDNKAKKFDKKSWLKTKFEDVAWCDESKVELVEVVDFLKHPKKYVSMWAKIPKWILLVWSPWTWKTLLAKAVAWEAWVPFFSISWSEFVEMFVWVWASRVRDLFKDAKECKTAIIFIDEIDAIWKQRWWWMWWWHDEREQTLNQILTEMDWFETWHNVIVLAATNRPEILDKALLRPWRFDRQVVIDKPDLKARLEILNVHKKWKKLAKNTDLNEVARKTPWFTWAELANILNEAAILAARFKKKFIEQPELLEAVEKVMMWPEKKSSVLTDSEKLITSYHEIGHALTSFFMPWTDPVHKISIIPRWMSLWSTWYLPENETKLYTETKFAGELTSLYWWHLAEKIQFWEVSTWASNDIERATKMARSMVTQYWMSSLWAIQWEARDWWAYTWWDSWITKNHSNEFAKKIDEEVVKILDFHYKNAEKILLANKVIFEELSLKLNKQETITSKEFYDYLKEKWFKRA